MVRSGSRPHVEGPEAARGRPPCGHGQRRGAGGDVRERRLAKFRQHVARFRLYRHGFLQVNTRFAAFLKIYQIITLNFFEILQIL